MLERLNLWINPRARRRARIEAHGALGAILNAPQGPLRAIEWGTLNNDDPFFSFLIEAQKPQDVETPEI